MFKKILLVALTAIIFFAVFFHFNNSKEINIYKNVIETAENWKSMEIETDEKIEFDNGFKNIFLQNGKIRIDNKAKMYEEFTLKTNYTKESVKNYYDLNKNTFYTSKNNYKKEELIHANDVKKYIREEFLKEVFNSNDLKQEKNADGYKITSTIKKPNEVIKRMSICNDNLFNVYSYVEKASCPITMQVDNDFKIESISVDINNYVKKVTRAKKIKKSYLRYNFTYQNVKPVKIIIK